MTKKGDIIVDNKSDLVYHVKDINGTILVVERGPTAIEWSITLGFRVLL